jgi:hypothetical protein
VTYEVNLIICSNYNYFIKENIAMPGYLEQNDSKKQIYINELTLNKLIKRQEFKLTNPDSKAEPLTLRDALNIVSFEQESPSKSVEDKI